jgi:hypothetical protein
MADLPCAPGDLDTDGCGTALGADTRARRAIARGCWTAARAIRRVLRSAFHWGIRLRWRGSLESPLAQWTGKTGPLPIGTM